MNKIKYPPNTCMNLGQVSCIMLTYTSIRCALSCLTIMMILKLKEEIDRPHVLDSLMNIQVLMLSW
jgi:hypothetical protein